MIDSMINNMLAALLTLSTLAPLVSSQGCIDGAATEINGNWYCQSVKAISYTNMGTPNAYNRITSMEDAQCSSAPQN